MRTEVTNLSEQLDTSINSQNDSRLINELYTGHVDILISEDRGILRKAEMLGVADRVFTIDGFLEKVTSENPSLIEYKVLSAKKVLLGHLPLSDQFFDSFRIDYEHFDKWFNRKSDEPAYVCYDGDQIAAFLYLKIEGRGELYSNIVPSFYPKRRLKIGSFKVKLNGFKLGERFLKIAFDNAISQRVDEIYVTVFPHSAEQERLIKLLEDFGFVLHGTKENAFGTEQVYVRSLNTGFNSAQPCLTFPFVSRSSRIFLVPIYPEYHTELLPDSILRTESPEDFIEDEPYRNAIRKVYVSRSYYRDLSPGDIIVFYRTGGLYKSVLTTLGIVEYVHLGIEDEEQFIRLCRKRSVFSDDELRGQWRYNSRQRPFIVGFLYAYSFPRRPNMATLIEHGIIQDINSAPRGFERISREKFETILNLAEYNPRVIVD